MHHTCIHMYIYMKPSAKYFCFVEIHLQRGNMINLRQYIPYNILFNIWLQKLICDPVAL